MIAVSDFYDFKRSVSSNPSWDLQDVIDNKPQWKRDQKNEEKLKETEDSKLSKLQILKKQFMLMKETADQDIFETQPSKTKKKEEAEGLDFKNKFDDDEKED